VTGRHNQTRADRHSGSGVSPVNEDPSHATHRAEPVMTRSTRRRPA
jgi:hypothetical protein